MKKSFLLALVLLSNLALSQSMLKYYNEPVERYFGYQHGDNLRIDEPYALYMDGVLYQKGYTDSEGYIKAIQKPGVKYITVKWIGSESHYEVTADVNDKWHDQGIFEGYYDNGQLKYQTTFKDKIAQNASYYWYPDGMLAWEIIYDSDKNIIETEKQWHKNGQRAKETIRQDGKIHGLTTEWYMSGEKKSEISYNQGIRQGKAQQWHKNGQLKRETHYDKDSRQGLQTTWLISGEKESETPFNEDYITGEVIIWYPNGTMAKKASHKYNQEDGLVQEWNDSGLLMKEYKAIKGKCFSRVKERNAKGELESRSCLTKNLTIPD